MKAVKFRRAGTVDFIPENIFQDFPNTIGFILEGSSVPILTDKYFPARFKPLKFLEIHHNDLEFIEETALKHLNNLVWIRLASNKIKILSPIFGNNKNLEYIDLRQNKIFSLVPGFFKSLTKLNQVLLHLNECIDEDFKRFDGTIDNMQENLEICFINCKKNYHCKKDLKISELKGEMKNLTETLSEIAQQRDACEQIMNNL